MANPASCSRRPAPCPAQPLPRSCPPPTPAHTSAESHPALPRSVLKHQPPGHNVARSEQSTARKHRYQQHRCNATSSSLTPESRRSQRRDPVGQILSPSQDCKGARGFPLPLPLPSPVTAEAPSVSKALILRRSAFPHRSILTVLKPLINCN